MKKSEVIEILISKGCNREDLKGIGIKELRKMLDQEIVGEGSVRSLKEVLPQQSDDDILLDIGNLKNAIHKLDIEGITAPSPKKLEKAAREIVNDSLYQEQQDPPLPSSPLWTQYVLSQFQDDELDGESPRVEGLRRVASDLLSGIVEEGCNLIMCPSPDNGFVACAKAWVIFGNGQKFEALADASQNNCTADFGIYPTAMADTRAKGRCYRAALMLKRVVCAEEKCSGGNIITNKEEDVRTGQISAVRILSERLKINPLELINKLFEGKNCIDIKSLDFNEAQQVIKELNRIRNETK